MSKLWQKDYTLDSLMEDFTVGDDYIIDRQLVVADAIASIAHARGLHRIGILKEEELNALEVGLTQVVELGRNLQFPITKENEDCHTAIEAYLSERIGEVGKKIHTGRSRNDQVQTALRLWMREFTVKLASLSSDLALRLVKFADQYKDNPMPGRTHMQLAMPSSVGLWASGYAEELFDEAGHLMSLCSIFDQSPLGSAASYGVPIPLDRQFTSDQMGFSKVQNNVLYANNSRGKFEAMLLDGCEYIALTLSKLAQDLMLFTLPEFGYFSLPAQLCTGSSIMPQKKNPDGLELSRSRSALVGSCALQVKSIIRSLPSGYNRDFQDTKGPLFAGTKATWQLVQIFLRMLDGLVVHPEALAKACRPELYATDVVLKRVVEGANFRDTYKDVGLHLGDVQAVDPYGALSERTSLGTTGRLGLEEDEKAIRVLKDSCEEKLGRFSEAYLGLCAIEDVQLVLY